MSILLLAAMLASIATLITVAVLCFRGEFPYCDDDMCMSVENVSRTPDQTGNAYRFAIRLFTRANYGPRSAKGATVYLVDERNRRFLPIPDHSAIPLDIAVQPGQSINTSLTFHTPSDAHTLAFAAGMDRLQYASFIIGNGDLLHNPRLELRLR